MRGEDIDPTARSYALAMSACAGAGMWPKAVALLSDMQQRGVPTDDVAVYNALIGTLAADGEWQLAVRFLQGLPAWGVEPDVGTYNAVLGVLEVTGQWEYAVRLVVDMKEKGLQPDVQSYTSAIIACGEAKQWEWAVHLFKQMKEAFGWPRDGDLLPRGKDEGEQLSAAEDEEEATAVAEPKKMSLEETFEGAVDLLKLAMKDGAFEPFKGAYREVLDLHGMNLDVAKTAVYMRLSELFRLPRTHKDLTHGLIIVTGKGLHSENQEAIIGPEMEVFLKEDFKLNFERESSEGTLKVTAKELRRVHKLGLISRQRRGLGS